jgi:hypothetical protein
MAKRMLLGILTTALLATTLVLSGQNASEPSVRTKSVEVTHLVSVEITVLSPEKDLVVPYCGDGGGRTESLCILPAYLEVHTNQGWRHVNLRHGGVLGGVPLNLRKVQLIPAGKNHDFSFSFRKEEFEVERGQQLRVVVAAWPDEQSMRTDEQPIHLASSSFECP